MLTEPNEKRWRARRVKLNAGLIFWFSILAFWLGPLWLNHGRRPIPSSPADFVPDVQNDCVPVVRLMKEFQSKYGHLPRATEGFAAQYLSKGYEFSGRSEDGFAFIPHGFQFPYRIRYNFTPGEEKWTVEGIYVNGEIPCPPVVFDAQTQPTKP